MVILVISVTIIVLAVIIAKVVLNHRDYRNEEFQYILDRNATNEESTGDHIYEWLERRSEVSEEQG